MKKDIYDHLRSKTERIIKEADKLFKRKKTPKDYCHSNCAGCLAVEAKGNVDDVDFKDSFGCFDSREDICLLEARDFLAEKYKLIIY